MSTYFYAYVGQYGNKLLVRSYKNGREQVMKIPYCPSLFVKSKKKDTEWKSIYEEPLEEIKFGDINDAKEFVKKYEDVAGYEIHGMTNFQYQYIANEFPGEIKYSLNDMNIQTLDIETKAEDGFPDVATANQEITLITLYCKHAKRAVTFGTKPFDFDSLSDETKQLLDGHTIEYFPFKDEFTMLKAFVGYWAGNYPTIVTGWNTQKFDFPYLCNRIARIIDENAVKQLSPFGVVSKRKVEIYGKDIEVFDILGIVDADYLELYRKYTYGTKESYSLEFIASEELGVGKLSYEGSFKDFYTNEWNTFCAYNIIDCIRVDQIDEKMQLIDLFMQDTFISKCNPRDTFGTVKPWDCLIHYRLLEKKIAIPPHQRKDRGSLEGAWVKDPQVGRHGWTISVDFSSLYPTIMEQWNISPDTFIRNFRDSLTVGDMLNANEGLTTQAATLDATVAANGTYYRRDKVGFLPEILGDLKKKRKTAKNAMLAFEQQYEQSGKTDKSLIGQISSLNNTQLAFKIKNNSVYGAVGNAGFRYFELPMAEAITLTGQFSDRHMEISLNKYLNKVLKTENVDYIIYGDTDSLYINVDPIVKQFYPDNSIDETVTWLDKFAEKAIQPIIDRSIDYVFNLCNCKNKLMDMKREAIASAGIFCKKKKYGMLVHNSEGVDYKPYKMKVMGLDIVKSSTPKMVREDLKDCMKYMFTETESKLQKHVLDIKTKFMAAEPEDIAFPRGVSDLNKYTDNQGKYQKGCPIHVRAAALYNIYKDKNEPPVRNGDKIKFIYLKLPNPIKEDVIGFPTSGTMPMRDALTKYIDWNAMWEKTFISPLEGLTDAIGWQHTKTASLEDFFC